MDITTKVTDAQVTLQEYAHRTRQTDIDDLSSDGLVDLLTDLRHYANAFDVDFGRAVQMSEIHFEDEKDPQREADDLADEDPEDGGEPAKVPDWNFRTFAEPPRTADGVYYRVGMELWCITLTGEVVPHPRPRPPRNISGCFSSQESAEAAVADMIRRSTTDNKKGN